MRVTTVIHIGTPKAGSSTLQSFLQMNYAALRSQSLDFPTVGRRKRSAHHNFVAELQGAKKFKPELGSLEELRQMYQAEPSVNRVLSAEMLENLNVSQIKRLKQTLDMPNHEFTILFVIRDLIELLPSSYAQKIRGGSHFYDFDTFYGWRIRHDRTDYFRTAAQWAEVFGWDRLRVRLLTPSHLVNGDLIDDFLTVAGLDPDEPAQRELPRPPVVNASIDWRVREAFRALYGNRHGLQPNHPLVRQIVASGQMRRKKFIEPLGEKIGAQLGWTADRGNYLTRAQAERALEVYRGIIQRLNRRLAEALPLPLSLDERGFVEREYLPDVSVLPPSSLRRFYGELQSAVDPPTTAISTVSYPRSAMVSQIAKDVAALVGRGVRAGALRKAMGASDRLLRYPTDRLRMDLRKRVFRQFSNLGDSYQSNDFESVDYEQFELAPDLPLFRGPLLSAEALESGDYFCVLGAAQTFGRLVCHPWPSLLSKAVDLPVLNISRGGVGPEFFLDDRLVEFARNARFVVLQVMSGRSVGCEDYPGGRRITRDGESTDVHRLDLLETLWNQDRAVALRYVERWNINYLALYARLRELIARPTLLLWISDRRPNDWKPQRLLKKLDWGSFPQLVGQELYESVSGLFEENFEMVRESSREQPLNRITGEPCPYFGAGKKLHTNFGYYPSSANHATLAEALTPWAHGALAPRGTV